MPQTVGEHVRKRRKEMKLSQEAAAKLLGVSAATVLNWEKGKTEPPIAPMPAIFRFLGYDPFPKPMSLPERLLAKRRQMGWSLNEAAQNLGVDEGTWRVWESGEKVPKGRYRDVIDALFLAGVS